MKAAYVKAPFEIVVKEAPRRALTDTEVRLDTVCFATSIRRRRTEPCLNCKMKT